MHGEREKSFHLLVDSIQDYGIFMLDAQGRIASWNTGAERIKGYAEAEVLGKHFSMFYTRADLDRDFPALELELAARDGRFEDEGWRVRKGGSRFWANVVITALRDADGELVGFAKVTRDLTERKNAEVEREALIAALAEESAAAVAANRAKSDFLANMSHELRTPINAIVGYVDLLDMGITGPITDKQRAQLERVRMSSQHLLGLIDDMLDFTAIEAGHIRAARERAPIAGPVDDAVTLLEPAATAKQLAFVNECSRDAGHCFVGDVDRVRQILANVLSNAVKFTEPGGRIAVSCATVTAPPDGANLGAGPWLGVDIEDTGSGIPAEHLVAIFEPFVQVETQRTRTKGGTGLGLSISRQLARLMGGELTVRSEVGQSTRFTLYLPTT